MILASHSTAPDLVRFEPIPALVQEKSCNKKTHICTLYNTSEDHQTPFIVFTYLDFIHMYYSK